MKKEPLKVTFEATRQNGITYVFIPVDEWMIVSPTFQGKNIILEEVLNTGVSKSQGE